MLLAARTDTEHFHTFIMRSSKILFISGRLTFEGAPGPAPFPSMIVFFDSVGGKEPLSVYSSDKVGNILA